MKGEGSAEKMFMAMAVVILVLISSFLIINHAQEGTRNDIVDQNCKTSIEKFLLARNLDKNFDIGSIDCPTKIVEYDESDEKVVQHKIAQSMLSCWNTWKKGEERFFADEGIYCHACTIFTAENLREPIPDIHSYLFNNRPPKSEKSYVEMITGYETGGIREHYQDFSTTENVQSSLSIDPDKQYAVVFVSANGMEFIRKLIEGSGGELTVTAYGIAGVAATGILVKTAIVLGAIPEPTLITKVAAGLVLIAAGTVATYYTWFADNDVEWYSLVYLMENTEENYNSLKCEYSDVQQNMFGS